VRLIREKVASIDTSGERPQVKTKDGEPRTYDLVVMATGVNSGGHKLLEGSELDYQAPTTTKTVIREYHVGEELIEKMSGRIRALNVPYAQKRSAVRIEWQSGGYVKA